MTDIATSDPTLITGTLTTSPEQVTRTRTIDEVVAEAAHLRSRARLLGEGVADTDREVSDGASWMEMPLVADAAVTAIDLAVAGRLQEVVEIAAGHSTGEEVLDRSQPGWRERYRSDFEVFEAPDGELGTRPVTRERP